MLARVKPLYVLIAGPVLLVIISAICFFTLVRPESNPQKEGSLAQLTEQAQGFEDRANERGKWEGEKATAERRLLSAQKAYKHLVETKSIPMNINLEPEYTIRLWFLYLEDFTKLTRQFLSKAPCEVTPRELSLGTPPMPPSPRPNSDGFLPMGAYTLTATGTLEEIWQFAHSLSSFPNCVVRLNSFDLVGAGDGDITATLPIDMWMIVQSEGPAHRGGAVGGASGVSGVGGGGGGGGDDEEEEEEEEDEEEEEEEDEEEEDDEDEEEEEEEED